MTTDDRTTEWQYRRPFGWGVVIIGDAGCDELPELERGQSVAASSCAAVVAVRHAQDVEIDEDLALVDVRCRLGRAPDERRIFEVEIALPSGQLALGDADQEDLIDLCPGTYRLQVALTPQRFAQQVDIWIHD